MKTWKNLTIPFAVFVLSFALGACGKRDDKFKQRETESALAAQPVEGDTDREAGQIAEAQNLKVDFVDIKAPFYSNEGGSQGIYVQSKLVINGVSEQMFTNHFNPNLGNNTHQSGTVQIAGHTVQVIAYCRDQSCRQYYILATISDTARARLQIGLKYDYDNTVNRWYTIRLPERFYRTHSEFVSFMDNAQNFM